MTENLQAALDYLKPIAEAATVGDYGAALKIVMGAAEAEISRTRDLEYPDYVPESVTDAAFASQADWWKPGDGDGHAVVLVPTLIESVTEASYRATLAHLKEAAP